MLTFLFSNSPSIHIFSDLQCKTLSQSISTLFFSTPTSSFMSLIALSNLTIFSLNYSLIFLASSSKNKCNSFLHSNLQCLFCENSDLSFVFASIIFSAFLMSLFSSLSLPASLHNIALSSSLSLSSLSHESSSH